MKNKKEINVSILGATGYTGGELLKILLRHPHVKITHVTSESSAGKKVEDVHPFLKSLPGVRSLTLEKPEVDKIIPDNDVAFLALPAGQSEVTATELMIGGCRVIDFAQNHRPPNEKISKEFFKKYGVRPVDKTRQAVYGLPELEPYRGAIKSSPYYVANPGCYATAAILALAPLAKSKMIDVRSIILDAKSGISGAGKKSDLIYDFSEANENMTPYAVAHHRHTPEIEGILTKLAGEKSFVTFTPQLAPMTRGILAISYAKLKKGFDLGKTRKQFVNFYKGHSFIRVLEDGQMPQTKAVLHTNFCDIGIAWDERTRIVIIASAIDNLVKGASGQAVQNMNLMFGLDETEGLL